MVISGLTGVIGCTDADEETAQRDGSDDPPLEDPALSWTRHLQESRQKGQSAPRAVEF